MAPVVLAVLQASDLVVAPASDHLLPFAPDVVPLRVRVVSLRIVAVSGPDERLRRRIFAALLAFVRGLVVGLVESREEVAFEAFLGVDLDLEVETVVPL